MVTTIGKFEVRCQVMARTLSGSHNQKYTGNWSVYLRPVDESDDPVKEGVTDQMDSYAEAEEEGIREASDHARMLDDGTAVPEANRDHD